MTDDIIACNFILSYGNLNDLPMSLFKIDTDIIDTQDVKIELNQLDYPTFAGYNTIPNDIKNINSELLKEFPKNIDFKLYYYDEVLDVQKLIQETYHTNIFYLTMISLLANALAIGCEIALPISLNTYGDGSCSCKTLFTYLIYCDPSITDCTKTFLKYIKFKDKDMKRQIMEELEFMRKNTDRHRKMYEFIHNNSSDRLCYMVELFCAINFTAILKDSSTSDAYKKQIYDKKLLVDYFINIYINEYLKINPLFRAYVQLTIKYNNKTKSANAITTNCSKNVLLLQNIIKYNLNITQFDYLDCIAYCKEILKITTSRPNFTILSNYVVSGERYCNITVIYKCFKKLCNFISNFLIAEDIIIIGFINLYYNTLLKTAGGAPHNDILKVIDDVKKSIDMMASKNKISDKQYVDIKNRFRTACSIMASVTDKYDYYYIIAYKLLDLLYYNINVRDRGESTQMNIYYLNTKHDFTFDSLFVLSSGESLLKPGDSFDVESSYYKIFISYIIDHIKTQESHYVVDGQIRLEPKQCKNIALSCYNPYLFALIAK